MRRREMLGLAALGALPARLRAAGRGPVAPTAEGLAAAFTVPDWYRDAKLGLWAHWGPQCAPEAGDWYGRRMYLEAEEQSAIHRRLYGHPADTGFIDVIAGWRAEAWDPLAVFGAYKAAGARFLVAMACHHDNFDLFPSPHHEWNSTRLGPGRDIVGGWAAAARQLGLPFGVSNHASHAWHWWQTAYGYDTVGPRKGERYDAFRLTRADGAGQAWEGLDPQALYTGARMVPPDGLDSPEAMRAWHDATSGQWSEDVPQGDFAFAAGWLARQTALVECYQPDFLYQDGHRLPFGDIGRIAAAHFYNAAIARTGSFSGVMTAGFTRGQGTLVTMERSGAAGIEPEPWQSATCIGDWHYNRARFDQRSYLPAAGIAALLADVVAKNGTLLLSVPVRGDGTLDGQERTILDALGRWMAREGEAAIYGSRPWRVFGEGESVRYTCKDGLLNAIVLAPQPGTLRLAALAGGGVEAVRLANGRPLAFTVDDAGLAVTLERGDIGTMPLVLRIAGRAAAPGRA